MSRYDEYYEDNTWCVALKSNSVLVKGKKYRLDSKYKCSDGSYLYAIKGMGYLFGLDSIKILDSVVLDVECEDEI